MKTQSPYQEVKFLAATFIFVALLGVFSLKNFLVAPVALEVELASRSPASFDQAISTTKVLNGQTVTTSDILLWNCKADFKAPFVTASHIRLKSGYCEKNEPQSLLVSNKTNGYTASVFMAPKSKEFSTDFIELKEGANEIQVTWTGAEGKVLARSFMLQRIPASTGSTGAATGTTKN